MREYKLMIPGPVEVSREVREAFNRPTVAHYGEEWAHFYLRTTERLSSMLGCTGQTFILPGS
ncbi:MAG: alanine--glyoxylate aminotransferase family protein, partial [Thermotogae bacterium]